MGPTPSFWCCVVRERFLTQIHPKIPSIYAKQKANQTKKEEREENLQLTLQRKLNHISGVQHNPYRAGLKPREWHGGLGISQAQASIMRAGSV